MQLNATRLFLQRMVIWISRPGWSMMMMMIR